MSVFNAQTTIPIRRTQMRETVVVTLQDDHHLIPFADNDEQTHKVRVPLLTVYIMIVSIMWSILHRIVSSRIFANVLHNVLPKPSSIHLQEIAHHGHNKEIKRGRGAESESEDILYPPDYIK